MSRTNVAVLNFYRVITKDCPEIRAWFNTLSCTEQCQATETARKEGRAPKTWREIIKRTGCYQYVKSRDEAAKCNTDPAFREKVAFKWCQRKCADPKTHN